MKISNPFKKDKKKSHAGINLIPLPIKELVKECPAFAPFAYMMYEAKQFHTPQLLQSFFAGILHAISTPKKAKKYVKPLCSLEIRMRSLLLTCEENINSRAHQFVVITALRTQQAILASTVLAIAEQKNKQYLADIHDASNLIDNLAEAFDKQSLRNYIEQLPTSCLEEYSEKAEKVLNNCPECNFQRRAVKILKEEQATTKKNNPKLGF